MRVVDFMELNKMNFGISDISVIYQTPQWNTLGSFNEMRAINGFLLIDDGTCHYEWQDCSADLSHGSLIYLPTGSKRVVTVTSRPFSFYRISFTITDLNSGEPIIFTEHPWLVTHDVSEKLFDLSRNMLSSTLSRNNIFKSTSQMSEFLHSIYKHYDKKTRNGRIVPAVRFIESNYTENISVDYLAELCALSKPHLFRLFKNEFGISPIEYRNQLRIERAKELLSDGECTISEISQILGFESVYYFSRIFKAHTNIPPSLYSSFEKH